MKNITMLTDLWWRIYNRCTFRPSNLFRCRLSL